MVKTQFPGGSRNRRPEDVTFAEDTPVYVLSYGRSY